MNLFLELRRHGKLADKRHPMYDKNKFGRFWMYLMAAFWAGYLIFFGTTFAFALSEESREPYQIINGGLIIILALDFLIRFPFQKTPTQEMKPYLLLPIKRNRLIDCLLLRSGLSTFNLFWLFFFVPLAIITVTRFYGVTGVVTYSIGIWLMMVMNNYWFLLCRTLMNERIWWTFLPLAVYGAIGCALFIPDDSPLFDWAVTLGEGFITGNVFSFLSVIVVIIALWFVNRKVMQGLVYSELNKVEDTTVKVRSVSEYRFLDRYGEIGEYMRLELKLLLRNKVCKASLRSIVIIVLMFSGILSFSDIYDSDGMKNFIMVYNYVIFGIMFLLSIMSYEGNYIDGLMSRKESIYSLLRAKYILYSVAILIPFLLAFERRRPQARELVVIAVLCALALGAGYVWKQDEAAEQLFGLLYRMTSVYGNAYGWDPVQLADGAAAVDIPMAVLGVLLSAAVTWSVCRKLGAVLPVAASLIPLSACMVVTDTVPDVQYLFCLLFGLIILILTGRVRRQSAPQGNRLTAMAAIPAALALAALFLTFPQESYVNRSEATRDAILSWFQSIPEKVAENVRQEVTVSVPAQEPDHVRLASLGRRTESPITVMEVTAEIGGTLYLRGQDYDGYDGMTWTVSQHRTEDFSLTGEDYGEVSIRTVGERALLYLPYYPARSMALIGGNMSNTWAYTASPRSCSSSASRAA